MFKLSHSLLVFLSGLVWFAVGMWLLPLGLNLLLADMQADRIIDISRYPMIGAMEPYLGGLEEASLLLVAMGLFIGIFKGRFVLGKSARRSIERIQSFPNPTSLSNIYSAKYYILLGSMIGLGVSIKLFGLPNDIRGFVDVAIGAALINGAVIYFRAALEQRKSERKA